MNALWDPPPRRVAVFRALQLGDMLCAVPALRALRAFLPEARITLVGLPWAQSFVERFQRYVDDLLAFPGFPGCPEKEGTMGDFLGFLAAARARRFDVAIQLHGSGELSNRITSLMAARRSAGFCPGEGASGDPWLMPWPGTLPESERYLALLEFLGVPAQGRALELPLSWTDWEHWEGVATRFGLRRRDFVCIHPGARLGSRRWPVERFADVGRALARDGWRIVVTGSPDERDLADAVLARLPRGAIDLTGQTTLGSLAALISKCALLVCNDTGVSHVAAAMGAASVVVASGSDVERWAPLDRVRHRVLWHPVACRPCGHESCPIGHPCALGVAVESVVAAARAQLEARRRRHAP